MKMKGIHILCASQSSTSTLDDNGDDQHTDRDRDIVVAGGGRGPAIDRYNPIIHDQSRLLILNPPQFQNNNNVNANHNISSSSFNLNNNNKADKDPEKKKKKKKQGKNEEDDENNGKKGTRRGAGDSSSSSIIKNWSIKGGRRSWSCMNPGAFITPGPGAGAGDSSRFLLTENTSLTPHPCHSSSHVSSAPLPFQVVLLTVSLHCRGCEKKLRKHISTMEGVSSYNIEFAAKKVTVEGNVTPLGVLVSISKVNNAQLCFPLVSPPAPSAPPQTISHTIIASSSLM